MGSNPTGPTTSFAYGTVTAFQGFAQLARMDLVEQFGIDERGSRRVESES